MDTKEGIGNVATSSYTPRVSDTNWKTVAEFTADAVAAQQEVVQAMARADRAKEAALLVRNGVAQHEEREQRRALEKEWRSILSVTQAAKDELEVKLAAALLEKAEAEGFYQEALVNITKVVQENQRLTEASKRVFAERDLLLNTANHVLAERNQLQRDKGDLQAENRKLREQLAAKTPVSDYDAARMSNGGRYTVHVDPARSGAYATYVDDLPPYKRPESPDCEPNKQECIGKVCAFAGHIHDCQELHSKGALPCNCGGAARPAPMANAQSPGRGEKGCND